jgi:inner membrane transporter RhtA
VKASALRTALLPLLVLVASMWGFQFGAALAKSLFPLVGARGTAVLRLSIAAVILCLAFRAWRTRLPRGDWLLVARYGAALGLMNLCFYGALLRLPLGVVVALEFTGPLSVALWHSRRALDFLWALLAIVGLATLVPWRASSSSAQVDWLGVALALCAAMFWALYILWGRRAGMVAGTRTVALGMVVGAVLVLPFGASALPALSDPPVLLIALGVALLSSVLPYTLEMLVLTQLPPRVFGVSMSLEPAIAALTGWIALGEQLSLLQWLAIGAIMVASGGAALSVRES